MATAIVRSVISRAAPERRFSSSAGRDDSCNTLLNDLLIFLFFFVDSYRCHSVLDIRPSMYDLYTDSKKKITLTNLLLLDSGRVFRMDLVSFCESSVSPVLLFFLSLSDSASFISVSDLLCSLPARFTLAFNIFVFVNLLLCV
ncbi:unnamed protein product [Brassica oleracea]|uniref:(rape) hypothetical protein n=1 Tax=Brassica napus TaxID=3708 RepID=A0A816NDA6_BRANA|nr:unnamed protein product [Brassica napus]